MSQRFQPLRGTRGSFGYLYSELSLAQGPVGIGVTGENRLIDFIGYAWLLVLAEDRTLHLYRQTATVGEWAEVTALLPPVFGSPLPEGARRVTFAFDQSARVTVAYELAETVYLTRWDTAAGGGSGAYVQNVAVAGVDPVVVFDATWAYNVPASDVLLFYVDAATRSRLLCRVQRDIYLIEYELHDYGQSVVLDRVARLPSRYEVLASDAIGDPLESGAERVALISELYPYLGADTMNGTVAPPVSGAYELRVLVVQGADDMLASAYPPTSGVYAQPVIFGEAGPDDVIGSAYPMQSGVYQLVIMTGEGDDAAVATAELQATIAGVYQLVVLTTSQSDPTGLLLSAYPPQGGTYAAP